MVRIDIDHASKEPDGFGQRGDWYDFNLFDDGCLSCVLFGNHQAVESRFARRYGQRQRAFDWPRMSLERQLTHGCIIVETFRLP